MGNLVGQVVVGKYRLVRGLGAGGIAEVYEATHEQIGGRFAVKVVKEDFAANPEICERFLLEAKAAAAVGHPGIVQVFDIGHLPDGRPFIVMEFLQGSTLADLLARRKKLGQQEAAGLCSSILDALEAAHGAGVVHRDLKPENVVLVQAADGRAWPKVIDFGIARLRNEAPAAKRLTAQGVVIGTPYYLSPEQGRGAATVDARTDVYAVGVMLFEMVTGRLPYDGDSLVEILTKVMTEPFPAPRSVEPALSPEMDRVILQATAFQREQRYASAKEFADALRPLAKTTVEVEILPEDGDEADAAARTQLSAAPPLPDPSVAASPPGTRVPGLTVPPRGPAPTPPFRAGPARPSPPPRHALRVHSPATPMAASATLVAPRRRAYIGLFLGLAALLGVAAVGIVLLDRSSSPESGSGSAPPSAGPPPAAIPPSVPQPGEPLAGKPSEPPSPPPAAIPDAGEGAPDTVLAVVTVADAPSPVPPRMATMRLSGLPAGAQARVDGREVGTEFPLEVSDASHVLRVVADGRIPFVREFRVAGDMAIEVRMARRGPGIDRERTPPRRDAGAGPPSELAENPFGNP